MNHSEISHDRSGRENERARQDSGANRRRDKATTTTASSGNNRETKLRGKGAVDGSAGPGLGWLSLGLGVALVAGARPLSLWLTGRDDRKRRTLMGLVGLRELAAGAGLLSKRRPASWLTARLLGDAADLALLGWALRDKRSSRTNVAVAAAAVLGITALDVRARRAVGQHARDERSLFDAEKSITVSCPPEAAYRYWRNFQNVPGFMTYVEAVDVQDAGRSHWWARVPGGKVFEWDAEVTEDRPTELIAWRTLEAPQAGVRRLPLSTEGQVQFLPAPGGQGIEVRLRMTYRTSSTAVARALGKLFEKSLEFQLAQDLRRFKQILEVGEIVASDASLQAGPHPAQPRKAGES